jgi:hypothetical protein
VTGDAEGITTRTKSAWAVRMEPMRVVLGSPTIRRLQIALFILTIGEAATWLAVLVYAYDIGGAAATGTAAAAQLLPTALLIPLITVAVDRVRRDRVLRLSYAGQAVMFAVTGLAMAASAPFVVVLSTAAVGCVLISLSRPAHGALVPELASNSDQVAAAIVLTSGADGAGRLIGPVLAGTILLVAGPSTVMGVMAGLLLVASLLTLGVHGRPRIGTGKVSGAWREATAGLRIVVGNRAPRLLLILSTVCWTVVGAVEVLAVLTSVELLGWGDAGAGYLNGSIGLGALVGVVAAASLIGRPLAGPFIIAWTVAAASLLLVGVIPVGSLLLLAGVGAGIQCADLVVRTLLQRATPSSVLGRVLGALEGINIGAQALGAILVSWLAVAAGTYAAILAVGVGLAILTLVFARHVHWVDQTARAPVDQIEALQSLPILSRLPMPVVEGLAQSLETLDFAAGEAVIRQGEEGDRLYLVRTGHLRVSRDGRNLAELGPGEVFGEIALLYDVPRTATVTAEDDCVIYALGRHEFLGGLGSSDEARSASVALADERRASFEADRPEGAD